jgi:hypothetical protein
MTNIKNKMFLKDHYNVKSLQLDMILGSTRFWILFGWTYLWMALLCHSKRASSLQKLSI